MPPKGPSRNQPKPCASTLMSLGEGTQWKIDTAAPSKLKLFCHGRIPYTNKPWKIYCNHPKSIEENIKPTVISPTAYSHKPQNNKKRKAFGILWTRWNDRRRSGDHLYRTQDLFGERIAILRSCLCSKGWTCGPVVSGVHRNYASNWGFWHVLTHGNILSYLFTFLRIAR